MIKIVAVRKFVVYDIDGVVLHVLPNGSVFRDGKDLSRNVPDKYGYIHIKIRGNRYLLHRIVYSALVEDIISRPHIEIDHINRDRCDNSIGNLRKATHMQNLHNRSVYRNSATGHKCISANYRANRDSWSWKVMVHMGGRRYTRNFLAGRGQIPDVLPPVPQYIIDIRDDMLVCHHGEFAST